MLSTISSFLPSALSLSRDDNRDKKQANAAPTVPAESAVPLPKKKQKPAPLNETFIVVRPPPAVSNHPLNLQLQLVPPASNRVASGTSTVSLSRVSMDSIARPDLNGTQASAPPSPSTERPRDTPTNRSVTDISIYTSTSSASLSSVSTNGSSSSTMRRIVPLYNLHAHNVMQNTILDAGTDAKVAKFLKKGLEIVDLTYLELFEVWGAGVEIPKSHLARMAFVANLVSMQSTLLGDPGLGSPMVGMNKRASIASFNSSSIHSMLGNEQGVDIGYLTPAKTPRLDQVLDPDDPNAKKGAKKFFGRMFKKKDGTSSLTDAPHLLAPRSAGLTPLTPSSARSSSARSSKISLSGGGSDDTPTPMQSGVPKSAVPNTSNIVAPLCPPVLDLQATLVKIPSQAHPRARPTRYVWIIRKWLKKSRIDSLKGLMTAASDQVQKLNINKIGVNQPAHADAFDHVEIHFEWARSSKKRVKRGRTDTRANADGAGAREQSVASKRDRPVSSLFDGEIGNDQVKVVTTSPKEIETDRRSTRTSPDRDSVTTDDREDSDPEDSDTPWNCTMVVHRLHHEAQQHHRGLHMMGFGSQSSSVSPPPSSGHRKALSFSASGRSGSGSNFLTPTLQSGHLQSASETTPKSSALSPPASSTMFSQQQQQSVIVSSPEPLEQAFEEPPQRLKIATLHPAPHHPKIVAQLKVPFPLPDIDLHEGSVRRRKAPKPREDATGSEGKTAQKDHDHFLSAEEIKDVICSTAFWLIVREGFGGVGKEKRKGDGWRIRG